MAWILILIQLIPILFIAGLIIYALILIIKVCKIYLKKNS